MDATKERARVVIKRLKVRYRKDMHTELEHSNSWELLVATILSAQAQDRQVNRVTKKLFGRYSKVGDYCALTPSDLYPYVKSIGLYKQKTKSIINAAKLIKKNFSFCAQLRSVGWTNTV